MKKTKRLITLVVLGVSILIAGLTVFTTNTFADSTNLLKKATVAGLYKCYEKGAYAPELAAGDYVDKNSIISNASAYTIYLPNGFADVDRVDCSQVLSGKGNYAGLYATAGITPPFSTSDIATKTYFLKDIMGYSVTESDAGGCVSYPYSRNLTVTSGFSTNTSSGGSDVTTICVKFASGSGDDAVINPNSIDISYSSSSSETASNSFSNALKISVSGNTITCKAPKSPTSYNETAKVNVSSSTKWGDLKNALLNNGCAPEKIAYDQIFTSGYFSTVYEYVYTRGTIAYPSAGETSATFSLTDKTAAANTAIRKLGGYLNYSYLALTPSEKRTLLQGYLDDYYKISTRCGISGTDVSIATGDGYIGPYTIVNANGDIQEGCYVKATQNTNEFVYVYDGDGYLGTNSFADFDGVLAMLGYQLEEAYPEEQKENCNSKALSSRHAAQNLINQSTTSGDYREKARKTIAELDEILEKTGTKGKPEDQQIYWYEDADTKQIQCYKYTDINGQSSTTTPSTSIIDDNDNSSSLVEEDNDGADISACKKATSLGWVICPFMHLIGKAAMGLFDQLAGQWLMINASEVEAGGSLYVSWSTFRDYANIGFAILFAVVVFSQVTGIGLSNYSIKKMLPTLIMIAVLVNISFFICQIAVDVTNIIGVEIGNILGNLGNAAMIESDGRTMGEQAGYALAGLFEAAGIVGLAVNAPAIVAASIPSAGFAIVGAISAGISALIGYFFLLILLALRKAILYVVIIVSPLAFICYVLPNTKSLFDKWKKLFMNLLLVFPICQILVSGGLAMSKIMMSNGNENSFFYQFTAMLLQIVPIFFIPMVLRNSMAMLGNIGAKVSKMGAMLGGNLSNTAKNSQLAKRTATSLNAWGANKAAGFKTLQRTPKSKFGRMLQANTRAKIATARTQAEDLRVADNVSKNMFDNDWYMDSVRATNDLKAQEDLADKYMNGVRNGSILDENGKAYDVNDLDVKIDGDNSTRDGSMVNMLINAIQEKNETKIKGIVKHLMGKGDKGFAAIGRALRATGFGDDGRMLHQDDARRAGFNMANKYLANNEKWGMLMKNWDAGTHEMVMKGAMDSDIATTVKDASGNEVLGADGKPLLQEMADFNITAAGKMSPSQTANAGDGVFNNARSMFNTADGMLASMANSSYAQSMRSMIDNMKAAYADDRIYSRMSGGAKRNMEKLYHDAQIYDQHKATVQAWIKSQAKTHPVTEKEIREYVEKSFDTIRSQVARNATNIETLESTRQLNVPR